MKEKIINHQQMIENLKNPSLDIHYKVYDENKGKRKKHMKKKGKYTLDQIGDALFAFIKSTNERLDEHDRRFDNIEKRLDEHDRRFDNIEKRLDEHDRRFDNIENR